MTFQQSRSPGSRPARVSDAGSGKLRAAPFQFTRFRRNRGHSLGAAAESSSGILVAATLGKQSQGQKRLIMTGIEIDRFLEAVFGSAAIAGGLADHSHQIVGSSQ